MSILDVTGWPCIPGGISDEEHDEILDALSWIVLQARQAPRQNHAPRCPIRPFSDRHLQTRILCALKAAPRPLEAIEIGNSTIASRSGGRTGPGHSARVYQQLLNLFDVKLVLGVMKTLSDGRAMKYRAPVFWTES